MQKRLYIILFLSFIFILNLVIYYSSSDYRFFLKKLKYWNDEIIHTDTKPLTDDYIIRNEVPIETISNKENSLDYILDDTDKVFALEQIEIKKKIENIEIIKLKCLFMLPPWHLPI